MKSRFHIPPWINRQITAQILLVILFLAVCVWISVQPNPFDASAVPPQPTERTSATPNRTQTMLKATSYQLEIEENRDQTLGIVYGGTVLVVLVVGATLLVIGKK
jgi:hypothetical protein